MVILSTGFLSCLNLLQLFVTWYWMRLIECWTTGSNPLSEQFCPSARPVSVPVTLSKLVIGRFYSFSFLVISICKELVIVAASTNSMVVVIVLVVIVLKVVVVDVVLLMVVCVPVVMVVILVAVAV